MRRRNYFNLFVVTLLLLHCQGCSTLDAAKNGFAKLGLGKSNQRPWQREESEFEDLATICNTMKWNARRPFYKRRKTPDEPVRKVKDEDTLPSIAYIVKHFRHYNPVARVQAAGAIGYLPQQSVVTCERLHFRRCGRHGPGQLVVT